MPDPRETLARIRKRADAATPGPWAPWRDQDGAPHMNGLLMVGNAAAVIPEGESWVEGVDVNPIAHTYTPEDREFIAHARTDVPALLDALEKVLELHQPVTDGMGFTEDGYGGISPACSSCGTSDEYAVPYPCPTVTAITTALEATK